MKETPFIKYDEDGDDAQSFFHRSVKETSIIIYDDDGFVYLEKGLHRFFKITSNFWYCSVLSYCEPMFNIVKIR